MNSIPTMTFRQMCLHHPSPATTMPLWTSICVICLAHFQENEEVKVLPVCSHSFHPVCIDQWLQAHSTCPICRSEVAWHHLLAKPKSRERHVSFIEILID
ncbi:hypothetical protein KP509_05G094800 [Ceratopteris richardii]|uniref:RING-type E3 ubiquitin transferase n=1 Tax=Ceratopteris richardii TaxID=49495 RepID=A0A8T2UWG3_CERRI|nr:hypothetical protein KP509_05G094800 [Ceratopteris richardii]